jgi:SlyX protein
MAGSFVSNSDMTSPATPMHRSSTTTALAPPDAATTALEQRLVELEIKASFADDLLDTLNGMVAQQQETIELLVREVRRLRQQQGTDSSTPGAIDPRDGLPPHY